MLFTLAKNLMTLLEVHYGFYFPTQVLNLAIFDLIFVIFVNLFVRILMGLNTFHYTFAINLILNTYLLINSCS